jgi:hypothetical protein
VKKILLISLALLFTLLVAATGWYLSKFSGNGVPPATSKEMHKSIDEDLLLKINKHAVAAEDFIRRNNYNRNICFLIDMSIESGKNRFFVYDLEKDSLLQASLVTHGRCNQGWLTGRQYGNKVGCGCTSLGKYRIANPYQGRFGLAYKLHGLDSTNSNAFRRYVVLHSHGCVPDNEVDPAPICQSDGCPTVSPAFLQVLAPMIDASRRPILLWIFE